MIPKIIIPMVILLSYLFLSEVVALSQQPVYDPFFEIFQLGNTGSEKIPSPDGGFTFDKTQFVLPCYRLGIFVAISTQGFLTKDINIIVTVRNLKTDELAGIIAIGRGLGKSWLEREWSYFYSQTPTNTVPPEIAKKQAKLFLDLWHGRGAIEPQDIPKIFH